MDDTALGQFVDHAGHRWKVVLHFLATGCFEVADRVARGLGVIFVPIPTLGSLAGIFFGRTVISHEYVFKEGEGTLNALYVQKNEWGSSMRSGVQFGPVSGVRSPV